jgi:hypothetical protein
LAIVRAFHSGVRLCFYIFLSDGLDLPDEGCIPPPAQNYRMLPLLDFLSRINLPDMIQRMLLSIIFYGQHPKSTTAFFHWSLDRSFALPSTITARHKGRISETFKRLFLREAMLA